MTSLRDVSFSFFYSLCIALAPGHLSRCFDRPFLRFSNFMIAVPIVGDKCLSATDFKVAVTIVYFVANRFVNIMLPGGRMRDMIILLTILL